MLWSVLGSGGLASGSHCGGSDSVAESPLRGVEWSLKRGGSEEPVPLLISVLLKEMPGCLSTQYLIAPTPLGFISYSLATPTPPPPVFSTSLLPESRGWEIGLGLTPRITLLLPNLCPCRELLQPQSPHRLWCGSGVLAIPGATASQEATWRIW